MYYHIWFSNFGHVALVSWLKTMSLTFVPFSVFVWDRLLFHVMHTLLISFKGFHSKTAFSFCCWTCHIQFNLEYEHCALNMWVTEKYVLRNFLSLLVQICSGENGRGCLLAPIFECNRTLDFLVLKVATEINLYFWTVAQLYDQFCLKLFLNWLGFYLWAVITFIIPHLYCFSIVFYGCLNEDVHVDAVLSAHSVLAASWLRSMQRVSPLLYNCFGGKGPLVQTNMTGLLQFFVFMSCPWAEDRFYSFLDLKSHLVSWAVLSLGCVGGENSSEIGGAHPLENPVHLAWYPWADL